MNDKIIICIGRQLGSGGRIIAKKLADEFNCRLYDKELLNLAAKESGFSEKFFEQNDERKAFIKSRFFQRFAHVGDVNFYRNTFSEDSLFQFQSEAIRKAAKDNSCVFVGRCADYVLREDPDTVGIFITADMEDRIKRVKERRQCSEDTARHIIQRGESQRASYYNFYTGKHWGESSSYDLCINSSTLGIESTAQLIADYVRKRKRCEP
ncbi:MAG: cytidylate kinase-like family protein [Prevotella sp.]|nr:cytidylate kinase-like family protein [Prevotella sp.]